METPDEMARLLMDEFVLSAHGNRSRFDELYAEHPEFVVSARWSKFNESALEAAGHTGQREIAEILVATGAPLTVFAAAMLGRRQELVQFLDQAGDGTGDARGIHGISLLYHGVLSGDLSIARLIRQRGASDEAVSEALHAAVRVNDLAIAKWLVDEGADRNEKTSTG